jgi:hypothetical protein
VRTWVTTSFIEEAITLEENLGRIPMDTHPVNIAEYGKGLPKFQLVFVNFGTIDQSIIRSHLADTVLNIITTGKTDPCDIFRE